MKKSGIYIITDLKGRIYVGSSKDIEKRIKNHKNHLIKIKHCNKKLQDYYKKYGEKAYSYSIIDLCTEDDLLSREQYFIDTLKPWYNVNLIAAKPPSALGRKLSPERKEQLRQCNLGRKHTPETLEKWKLFRNSEEGRKIQSQNSLKAPKRPGRTNSPETRLKISKSNKGRKLSPEHIKQIGDNSRGRKASDATKEKMRISQTGRKHTPESIEKMKEVRRKRWQDPEYRKIGLSHLNKLSEQKRKTG